jgi:CPA1 family monovalent cation:H+ antiporter
MCLSASLAYGSYLSADALGASGPLACVSAGIVHGSYGRLIGMSPNTRALLDDLWEFLGFIANAFVFLLLGLTVHVRELFDSASEIALAACVVLLARWAVTLTTGIATLGDEQPQRTLKSSILLTWGGLRGALTASLALALPSEMPYRTELVEMTFGVVLFTLVVQALSLPTVIKMLDLDQAG